jgi:hypothetical protein
MLLKTEESRRAATPADQSQKRYREADDTCAVLVVQRQRHQEYVGPPRRIMILRQLGCTTGPIIFREAV